MAEVSFFIPPYNPESEVFPVKLIALLLFAVTYLLILFLPRRRAIVALSSAALFLFTTILSPAKAWYAIDWNVLLTLLGMMGMVSLFVHSGAPAWLADRLAQLLPDARWIFIVLSLFAGLVSAFIDNVATVLMVAPIGLSIARKLKVSPVPAVLAIAVSSNLQGAATLVGDTTSILLGRSLGMEFTDFFIINGRPGMFFVVQAGMLATVPVLLFLFRKDRMSVSVRTIAPVNDWMPTVFLLAAVASLVAASFFPQKPSVTNGILCTGFFLAGLIWTCIRNHGMDTLRTSLSEIDWDTLLLLAGLFIIIEGIVQVGIVSDISSAIVRMGGNHLFFTYTVIVWMSVLLSAFIDNIPYVAAMLPVVAGIGKTLGVDVTVLYFGLLAGATLGGNLTPVGASANIAATGILRREGYEVSTKQFLRIGVPFTLAAVITGYILIWVIYAS